MLNLKNIWKDPVWSKVIAAIIIAIGSAIFLLVKSSLGNLSYWDTLIKTLKSPMFLYFIISLLSIYIIVYKCIESRKIKKEKLSIKNIGEKVEGKYSWKDLEIGVTNLREQLISDGYIPSLLVGIGRGGAVVSALLSGNMIDKKHIPFIALDRKYEEERGMRKARLFDDVVFKKDLDKVLLVAGDVYTGDTATVFIEFLQNLGAKEIKFLVFTKVNSTKRRPDYYYINTSVTELNFPWMLSDKYVTDART